jgi:hypothetical protein
MYKVSLQEDERYGKEVFNKVPPQPLGKSSNDTAIRD